MVAGGIAKELHIDSRIEGVETQIRGVNEQLFGMVSQQAENASSAAGRAKIVADAAEDSAARASNLSRSARQEADSFEGEINSANETATEAERHLADALREAAQAQAELNRIRSPRSLTNEPALIAVLLPFKGTEYMFLSVAADDESITLLKQIDDVLQQSGWKRAQPSRPFPPAIAVWGRDVNMAVSQALTTGIEISIESNESALSLNSMPAPERPLLVKAAEALNAGLARSLSPPQESLGKTLRVEPGDGKFVRIAIGRKPM